MSRPILATGFYGGRRPLILHAKEWSDVRPPREQVEEFNFQASGCIDAPHHIPAGNVVRLTGGVYWARTIPRWWE